LEADLVLLKAQLAKVTQALALRIEHTHALQAALTSEIGNYQRAIGCRKLEIERCRLRAKPPRAKTEQKGE